MQSPQQPPQPSPEPPFDATKLPTSEEIRLKVHAIREMYNAGKTLHDVRVSHTEFARQYPKLVETLMQKDLDTKQLQYMLSMFDRVRNQQMSFQRASHKVGKSVFDKYLAPNLTPEQLATVQAKLKGLEQAPPEEIARQAAALSQSTQMGAMGGAIGGAMGGAMGAPHTGGSGAGTLNDESPPS